MERIAVVTGGTRGLGRAISPALRGITADATFLAEDAAGLITGATFDVDGGHYLA